MTACHHCAAPIEPVEWFGIVVWQHAGRPEGQYNSWAQYCNGITAPRIRATPKETNVTPAKKPLLHRGRKPTARRKKRRP